MKRGLIAWDKTEIPPDVFVRRLDRVRRVLRERQVPALAVYSDLWRSNQARFFSNYMPYFNRALLVIPADQPPTLLCGLSPRVYGWIRSVTTIEDVRPAPNFQKALAQLSNERQWTRLGVLDFDRFPHDLHQAFGQGSLDLVNIESEAVYAPGEDENEIVMRTRAAEMARDILEKELPKGIGSPDYSFAGRLERQFRRLGAEDLVILVTNGHTVPAPACGATLEENASASIALEYRGHWARVTRPQAPSDVLEQCRRAWTHKLSASSEEASFLGGSYPFECGAGAIPSLHIEFNHKGKRLFYGDMIL